MTRPGALLPRRACIECGSTGRRASDLCRDCAGGGPLGLTGGRWVIDIKRRVVVWRKDGAA